MFHRLTRGWKGQWLELAQQGKEKRGDSWIGEATRQETDSGEEEEGRIGMSHLLTGAPGTVYACLKIKGKCSQL